MPELPEVEAARLAVEEHCVGKKIKKAVIANDTKVIEGVSPSDFEAALLGKTVVSARRKGKNLWLQLDSPPFPSFQFGTVLFRNPKNITEKNLFLFVGRVWFVSY
jgi:formamidopyrimidine-DNA glycosylase